MFCFKLSFLIGASCDSRKARQATPRKKKELQKAQEAQKEPQMTQMSADLIKEGGHSCPPLPKNRGLENPLSVTQILFILFIHVSYLSPL